MSEIILYFGCEGRSNIGHYLFRPGMNEQTFVDGPNVIPWGYTIDGKVLEVAGVPDRPGAAVMAYKGGWSALCWWDRGGDSRPASNSAILSNHDGLNFDQMMDRLRTVFPSIAARQKCEIKLWPLPKPAESRAAE